MIRGYNIEAFRPGDYVEIIDPSEGVSMTYWDFFDWNEHKWDRESSSVLPPPVPIKTVQYEGSHAQLELSERPPSQVADTARLYRWLHLSSGDN